ncbi:TonB-dependent siderophore receptor [Acinetobacter baumannii]|uniref:TonB-dependent siderophore receptor n=1 Tax=Acinetobacter baumannii TaxID=470 RepID=UPI00081998A8|nr:TonB-dependent siderophore receptor [Acinetobacter baumannii]EIB7121114.1 TonB-dependent siderophore receptor [Acinetobacter baumannii]EJB8478634.1 TonB-dependent siderophore receptor [Acinetobacter baumannii]EKU3409297.1 TonB-dependent siderophore receptor [Acinetobacter baumannii]MBD0495004.1 TonB-dependent siderophore receptor [Acinetobacter baumannii]MCT9282285.1 TonB-dependent siderophore receptor [Acinetobacter baumannii]
MTHRFTFSTSKTLLAVAIFTSMTTSHAEETAEQQNSTNVLPTISIQAQKENPTSYIATKANSALKSDASLFKTAQSVSVVTREQLDQKQARTLTDALEGVAGVEAGKLGRRGWDDFIIRGQTSSDSVYVDGLRIGQSSPTPSVAAEISGMDQVQILKGPASINFGLVAPGGMVNLVTKRPEAESFARASMTYGSYSLKEGTFDLNYSPNNSEKGAFRLNGRISDQDDPTDYVYFKNFYISPSYNFDLGDNTDLSVIASYQHREYIRQQGLPVIGTLKDNPNGPIDRSLYIGDPNFGKYEADVYRTGYTFKHTFDNGWNLNQNFAVQKTEMDGQAVFAQTKKFWADSTYTTINRANNSRHQIIDNLSFAIDNRLNKQFDLYGMQHDVNIGVDAFQEKSDYTNDKYNIGNLNIYDPVYGQAVELTENVRNINRLKYLGLYLRDRIQLNDQLLLSLSGRQDWAQTQTRSLVNSNTSKQSDNAFTGSASVMYTLNDIVAPYVSYATSFTPNSGTDVNSNPFKPEKGKQVEVGMKLQSPDQRIQGAIAWYDLKRQNVVVNDSVNPNEKVQRGEQLTRGIETELSAVILEGLKLTAAYTYTIDAEISKDANASNVGKALDNIPEHAYSLSARYKFDPASKLGWYIGGGFRGETYKTMDKLDVHIPGYTVFDTEAGYNAEHWGAQLAIRNLFDKDYYAGALNENLVTLGNPRQINFTVKFNY